MAPLPVSARAAVGWTRYFRADEIRLATDDKLPQYNTAASSHAGHALRWKSKADNIARICRRPINLHVPEPYSRSIVVQINFHANATW